MPISDDELKNLKLTANSIRQDVIKMVTEAKSGHTGGPLGMADVFTALYFKALHHDAQNPTWDERDRVVLSNGHICPVLYATMAHSGYFPTDELKTLRKFGTRLQGHPHRSALPGLETTSGPLGSGISQASGMAYGLRMDGKKNFVYCLTSDGEHNEGNTWEADLFAGKYKLSNLIVFMDRNKIQIDGNTEDVMPMDPVKAKYEAFNWHVKEINGHDFNEILDAIDEAKRVEDKPTMIVAYTIPGKGVDFMENRYEWHGTPPDLQDVSGAPPKGEQEKVALEQLQAIHEKIERGEM